MGYETTKSRRSFVRRMTGLLASGAAAGFLPQLGVIRSALAATQGPAAEGYRALVCVYLSGGNDVYNWLVPTDDARYANYVASRSGVYDAGTNPGGLAIPRAQDPQTAGTLPPLLPLSLAEGSGSYGLNPYCPELQGLFNAQRLAFLSNIGTLVQPINKTEYNANSVPRPPQLYSHNDQELLWYLARTDPMYRYGWGGRTADLVKSQNSGSVIPALSPCISISGANRFENGQTVVPYQMSTSGATQLDGYYRNTHSQSTALRGALSELLALDYDSLYTDEYQATLARSVLLGTDLTTRLAAATFTPDPFVTPQLPHPPNSLADQLKMVARMIKVCSDPAVGIQRQVFYVRIGSFDTHSGQITSPLLAALGGQGRLLQQVSEAMKAFDDALKQIGQDANVLTFTMSEFARTLQSNGAGSDHAWGGIQMVMGHTDTLGGSLHGGRIYGGYPDLVLNGNTLGSQSFSRGQFIPTLGVEQMMASLASWLGVADGDLPTVFPNLANFGGVAGKVPFLS